MNVTSLTIGLPVRDLPRSRQWYARLLEIDETPLEPVDGVIEFDLGEQQWLQIFEQEEVGTGVAVRFGVADVAAERQRLVELGLEVADLVRVEGVLEFADLHDPDGHLLTVYTMLDR